MSGEHVISSTEECQPPYYEHIEENEYLFDRWVSCLITDCSVQLYHNVKELSFLPFKQLVTITRATRFSFHVSERRKSTRKYAECSAIVP